MKEAVRERAAVSPAQRRWRLAELVSIETLQSIQDTFASAFGLSTVIVDPDGEPATQFTHRLGFCEDLTRSTPLGGARCAQCQGAARTEARVTHRPSLYRCWNGLHDAAIPIAPKGEVVGYFLCGQVLAGAPDLDRYRETAEEIGADPDEYIAGLQDVRIVPLEQYKTSVRSMHVLAKLISDQAAAAIDNLAIFEQAHAAERDAAARVAGTQAVLDSLRELPPDAGREQLLEALCDGALRLLSCDACAVHMADERDCFGEAEVIRPAGVATLPAPDPDWRATAGDTAWVVGRQRSHHVASVALARGERLLGMLVATRAHRSFAEHELDAAVVLAQVAAARLDLLRLEAEAEARTRRQHVLTELLDAATRCDETTFAAHLVRAAVEVLDADGAVAYAGDTALARVGIGAEASGALLATRPGGAMLVRDVSVTGGQFTLAALRDAERPLDAAVADALAAWAAIGLESIRSRARVEQAAGREKRLATLVEQLAKAADVEDVERALLAHVAAVVGADVCAVVAIDDEQPGTARIRAADADGIAETAIALEGPPRVAAVRLRRGRQPRAVFEAWAAEALAALASLAGTDQHLAEPVHERHGTRGAVVAAWRDGASRPSSDEARRLLRLIAQTAAGALARFRPPDGTHADLRTRVDGLEAIARLATRLVDAGDEAPVLEALIEVATDAGRFDGAALALRSGAGWDVKLVAGLGPRELRECVGAASGAHAPGRVVRVPLSDDTAAVVVATDDGGALLVGRRPAAAGRLDEVLPRLLADAMSALARAGADERQRVEAERLEREGAAATQRLARAREAGAARDAVARAALDGLEPLAAELVAVLGGAAAVVAPDGRGLAHAGGSGRPSPWRPPRAARTIVQRRRCGRIVAAPAAAGGETLAWVVSEDAAAEPTVVRTAVEHAALMAASVVLRERAALEVEMRMRGGFVDDLCAGCEPEETLVARGATLGIDVTEPSRVLLVEPSAGRDGVPAHDLKLLHDVVAECARAWPKAALVAARGRGIAVVFAEIGGEHFEDRLRAALDERHPDVPFAIAVGAACRAIGDYAASETAARHALDVMRMAGRAGETFSFRHESFETVLLQATEPEALLRFVARYVEPLERADTGRSIELRRTLETYFACGRNLEQTARALHVHVSTLRYRLARACEAARVEPKDEAALLDLQLALAVSARLGGGSTAA